MKSTGGLDSAIPEMGGHVCDQRHAHFVDTWTVSVTCDLFGSLASEMSASTAGGKKLDDVEAIEQVPLQKWTGGMKIQEVILKTMAGKLKWWEAAEIIEATYRMMRRLRQQYEEHGDSGLWITASSVRVRACTGGPSGRCCGCTESSTST